MVTNAIVPMDVSNSLDVVKAIKQMVSQMTKEVLVAGVDYGAIPGTGDKPTLLLPGMEKLTRALNAVPRYTEIEVIRDFGNALFYFEYECCLVDADNGLPIPGGVGRGSCNSYETAFRWRWVSEDRLPRGLDISTLDRRDTRKTVSEFLFAIEKAETTGAYGKPAEYWNTFQTAMANRSGKAINKSTKKGDMPAYEIMMGMVEYRIPNPDIYDQINAILKRAIKRALAGAVKGATNSSEFFTVDLDDGIEEIVKPTEIILEGEFSETPSPMPAPALKPKNGTGVPNWWSPVMTEIVGLHFENGKHAANALNKLLGEGSLNHEQTAAEVIAIINSKYPLPVI